MTWTANVDVDYLCPAVANLLTLEEMPQTTFTYDVTLLQSMQATLPEVEVEAVCHSVSRVYFQRQDTLQEVSYLTPDYVNG